LEIVILKVDNTQETEIFQVTTYYLVSNNEANPSIISYVLLSCYIKRVGQVISNSQFKTLNVKPAH
jgi:hypothetical protein